MICKNCGFKNEENSSFCGQCGVKLGGVSDTAEAAVANAETADTATSVEAPALEVETPSTEEKVDVVAESPAVDAPVTEDTAPKIPIAEAPSFDVAAENIATGTKKNGSTAVKFITIAAAVVVAIAVALGVFWRPVVNTVMNIMPAKTHLKWVYANSTADLGNNIAEIYGRAYDNFFDAVGGTTNLELTLESTAKTLIKQAIGADLDIDSLSIDFDSKNNNDGSLGFDLDLKLNNESFIEGTVALDYNDMIMSVSLPELNKEALILDLNDILPAEQTEVFAAFDYETSYSAFEKILPESDLIKKLLVKYAKVAIDSVEEVDRSSEDYQIGNVSADATCFEVEISSELARDMLVAVLEEAKEDEEILEYLEKCLNGVVEFGDVVPNLSVDEDDIDTALDMYPNAVKRLVKNLESSNVSDEIVASFNTYVNGSGEILAIELKMDNTDSGIIAGTASDSDKIAYGAYLYNNDQYKGIVFEGEGKSSSFSGDLKVLDGDIKTATSVAELVDFDFDSLAKGFINGKINVDIPTALITLEVDVESNKDSFKLVASVPKIATITLSSEVTSGGSIDVETEGNDNASEWASDIDLDALLKKLEGFGIDENLLKNIDLGSLMGAAANQNALEAKPSTPSLDQDYGDLDENIDLDDYDINLDDYDISEY